MHFASFWLHHFKKGYIIQKCTLLKGGGMTILQNFYDYFLYLLKSNLLCNACFKDIIYALQIRVCCCVVITACDPDSLFNVGVL